MGEHITDLTRQLARIVRDGVSEGGFRDTDPDVTAGAVFLATGRFHDPAHARDWEHPNAEDEFEAVVDLVIRGLRAG